MNYEEYMELLNNQEIIERHEELGSYEFEAEMEKMLRDELLGDIYYKECSSCGLTYPSTLEYFAHREDSKDGLNNECKECVNRRHREMYEAGPYKERLRAYYQTEKGKEVSRKAMKKYLGTDKGKIASFNNAHRRRVADGDVRLAKEQWLGMMKWWGWRCAYSGKVLTPSNRSIDHVLAITKGGTNDIWNLVPCDKSFNSSKHNKEVTSWLIEKGLYSEELMARLEEWQEYAKNNLM